MRISDVSNDNPLVFPADSTGVDAIDSLHAFLTDHGPISAKYQVNDVLALDGRVADVIATNPRTLCLKFRDNGELKIIDRRAPNLEPARPEDWRNDKV